MINKNVEEFFSVVNKYYNDIQEAFLNKDYNLAYEVWFKRDTLKQKAKTYINELDFDDVDKLKDMVMIVHACKDMSALI